MRVHFARAQFVRRWVKKLPSLAEAVPAVLPVYEIPDDDLVGEVLVPSLAVADEVRVAAGYFSSRCLAQVAPGLAAYLNSGSGTVRILLSPEITEEDRDAIDRGVRTAEEVLREVGEHVLEEASFSASALVSHTLDCLAYLVAADRLEFRFVLMDRGMYHKKQWLVRQGDTWLSVHGSGNATARGLLVNGEQMTVDCPWKDGPTSARRVQLLSLQWERQWNNQHSYSVTLSASQALRLIRERAGDHSIAPTTRDFWAAWRADHDRGLEPELPPRAPLPTPQLRVPEGVEWQTGPFAHQGRAVQALFEAGGRGILSIATGGGKTRTALIAATRFQDEHAGPTFILVLVPSAPLMRQWAADVREFGVEAFLPSQLTPVRRRGRLQELRAGLDVADRRTEVVISSNALFAEDEYLRAFIADLVGRVETVLIGDEVHNLGAPSFLKHKPARFNKRIGLSATPIRQYDPDGTDALFDYFGPQVFEFSLAEAISVGCLTPYDYHLHEVVLLPNEMDKYTELTEALRRAGFHIDDDGRTVNLNERVEQLLRERRAVLEQAEGKIQALQASLQELGPSNVQRTLIYASAKGCVLDPVRQIDKVNALLTRLGIIAHQFTSEETASKTGAAILERFGHGDYQVLTAMRVLDEGVDIPQTDSAYILASSTVRREWVQRRGRILRRAPGKTKATIHDFLVVPPDLTSSVSRSVIRGELRRAREFAGEASNEWTPGGPRAVIERYESLISGGGS